jgi:hypothetical protein
MPVVVVVVIVVDGAVVGNDDGSQPPDCRLSPLNLVALRVAYREVLHIRGTLKLPLQGRYPCENPTVEGVPLVLPQRALREGNHT